MASYEEFLNGVSTKTVYRITFAEHLLNVYMPNSEKHLRMFTPIMNNNTSKTQLCFKIKELAHAITTSILLKKKPGHYLVTGNWSTSYQRSNWEGD